MTLSIAMVIAASFAAAQTPPEPGKETDEARGFVEFSKDPNAFARHSIQIFAVLEGKNRLMYIDELGSVGLRAVTVETPVGERAFVVVVTPGNGRPGAPADPVRRTRPNVRVTVEPGMTTPVHIGGFTDFVRAPSQGDTAGTKFVRASDDPEASQFRTQIEVGKPETR